MRDAAARRPGPASPSGQPAKVALNLLVALDAPLDEEGVTAAAGRLLDSRPGRLSGPAGEDSGHRRLRDVVRDTARTTG
ncbi:hypothetical protein AB0C81_14860 [Streptomyces roseoverticillatus]|uniref:hypothetical protein n=1 Tax=Streptomyces roseoverticillatus TaxID=66429 RepID=UPI0033C539CF